MDNPTALVGLPLEVLKIIASYLLPEHASALSRTCRFFRDIGQGVVFEEITLDDFEHCLNLEEITFDNDLKKYVRRLHLGKTDRNFMSDSEYERAGRSKRRALKAARGQVYDRAMEAIIVFSLLPGMTNITHLSCVGNIFYEGELAHASVLDHEYGAWNPRLAIERLPSLADRLSNVTHLRLQDCDEVILDALWHALKHLQVVKLRHISTITWSAFDVRNVRKLSIDQKCPFSGETLRILLQACRCLENLSFRRYYEEDDDDFVPKNRPYSADDLVNGLCGKDLKKIKIFDSSLDVERDEYVNILDRIVENCPNLTSARFNIELASENFFANAKALKCAQISGEGWTVTDTKIVEMLSKASPAFEKLFVRISSTVLETLEGDGNPWTYAQTERILKEAERRQIAVTVEIKHPNNLGGSYDPKRDVQSERCV